MSVAVDIAKEFVGTVSRLAALETRTEDVAHHQDRIEAKLDLLIDRLARIEANYENLKSGVKNEIMAEIKAELRETRVYLDLQSKGLLNASGDKLLSKT